jgi:2-alkenal reductase
LWFAVLLLTAYNGFAYYSNAKLPGTAGFSRRAALAAEFGEGERLSLVELQDTFEQIYRQVSPSVVNIVMVNSNSSRTGGGGRLTSQGSGFVWDKQGHIITNHHVIDGAGEILVTFSNGQSETATLAGADPYSDLAVIRVNVPETLLAPVSFADSSQVRVGQLAVAIGNPFGMQGTMSQGIISGIARSMFVDLDLKSTGESKGYSIPGIIQTDAPIRPGSSGGVLVDHKGLVIGVTTALASNSPSSSGMGFVIPSAIVKQVVPALIEHGSIQHPWLGARGVTLTPGLASASNLPTGQKGVLVLSVTPGGPAAKAGLVGGSHEARVDGQLVSLGGDIIIAIEDQPVGQFEQIAAYLFNQAQAGRTVSLSILRDGEVEQIQVRLGSRPE